MALNAIQAHPAALPSLPRAVALLMTELAHDEPSLRRANQLMGDNSALTAHRHSICGALLDNNAAGDSSGIVACPYPRG